MAEKILLLPCPRCGQRNRPTSLLHTWCGDCNSINWGEFDTHKERVMFHMLASLEARVIQLELAQTNAT